MYKIGEEEMVLCPYNRHHVVSKLRIQKHIIKCQKLNPDVKLATCFYNYSHRLKPEDLLAHYEICSHKTRIEGARYCGPTTHTLSAAGKNKLPLNDFPDINAKAKFFHEPPFFLPNLNQKFDEDSQKFSDSDSESESWNEGFHLKLNEKVPSKTEVGEGEIDYYDCDDISVKDEDKSDDDNDDDVDDDDDDNDDDDDDNDDDDDDNDDDDLEPLPLPKTVSEAFIFFKQQTSKPPSLTPSKCKPFGRGKSLVAFSPPKESRPTDHLLPDLRGMESTIPKHKKMSTFFCKSLPVSSSKSVVSSMFDDTTTLKSEEITFDDESNDDDDKVFILKNFDKYTKI